MKSFVKLYTNAPSWIFTLGYVLKSRDMVPDEWTHAMGDAATEPPTVTNPYSENGFDKITQQAFLFLKREIHSKANLDAYVSLTSRVPAVDPKNPIFSATYKLFQYRKAQEKRSVANRIARKVEQARKESEAKAEKQKKQQARRTAAKSVKSRPSVKSRTAR